MIKKVENIPSKIRRTQNWKELENSNKEVLSIREDILKKENNKIEIDEKKY